MKIKVHFIIFFLIFSFASVQAMSEDPTQTIKGLIKVILDKIVSDDVMKDVVSKDKKRFEQYRYENKKFHREISQFIDFERLGTDSMPLKYRKQYWRGREKKKFLALLQELVEEIVYPRGKDFFNEVKIEYQKPHYSEDGKMASVFCYVQVKNKKAQVQYRLIQREGKWQIYDVNLEGEWWTESFRSQFNHVITEKSYTELISRMEKKLSNVKNGLSF